MNYKILNKLKYTNTRYHIQCGSADQSKHLFPLFYSIIFLSKSESIETFLVNLFTIIPKVSECS